MKAARTPARTSTDVFTASLDEVDRPADDRGDDCVAQKRPTACVGARTSMRCAWAPLLLAARHARCRAPNVPERRLDSCSLSRRSSALNASRGNPSLQGRAILTHSCPHLLGIPGAHSGYASERVTQEGRLRNFTSCRGGRQRDRAHLDVLRAWLRKIRSIRHRCSAPAQRREGGQGGHRRRNHHSVGKASQALPVTATSGTAELRGSARDRTAAMTDECRCLTGSPSATLGMRVE